MFDNCRNLESIAIPRGVEIIQEATFAGCSNLSFVSIPDSVIEIGSIAFMNCLSLLSISPLNNVVKIGRGAFAYCELLDNIILSDKITVIESGIVFSPTQVFLINTLVLAGVWVLVKVVLPVSVLVLVKV